MVIFWSAILVLATLAVLGAFVVYSRRRPSTRSDLPARKKADLYAEGRTAPRRYRAPPLVTWSVSRCEDEQEMNDESPG